MKRIYLDQMKWIDLAAARLQKEKGRRYLDVLDIALAGVERSLVSFPLSSAHYIETTHRRSWRSRQDLAITMARLSRFHSIAPLDKLLPGEIDRALQQLFGRPEFVRTAQVFGVGIGHALGTTIAYHLPAEFNIDPIVRAEFERWAQGVEEMFLLGGLPPEVEDSLPGFDLTAHQRVGEEGAKQNEELRALRRADGWLSGERSKRLAAASAYFDFMPWWHDALQHASISVSEFFALGKLGLTTLAESVPTIHVCSELHRLRESAVQQAWSSHDLVDIDALSRALVYCDVVVTERQWVGLIGRTDLAQKCGARVLSDLADLAAYLVSP